MTEYQEMLRRVLRGEHAYVREKYPKRYVCLTFDDGLEGYQSTIASELNAVGIRATFFIPPKWIDQGGTTPAAGDVLTWDQIREIRDMGHEIGNHSYDHPDMTTLTEAEQEAEIVDAEARFQAELGLTPKTFAYPYAKYNDTTIFLLRKHNYKGGRGVAYKAHVEPILATRTNPYRLGIMGENLVSGAVMPPFHFIPLPAIYLWHGQTWDDVKYVLRRLLSETYFPTEFVTFSEYIDLVQRWKPLGLKVHGRYYRWLTEGTHYINPIRGWPAKLLELYIQSNSPELTIHGFSGLAVNLFENRAFLTDYNDAGTWDETPSLTHINDGALRSLFEVVTWDPATPMYRVRIKHPVNVTYLSLSVPIGATCKLDMLYAIDV